MCEEIYETYRRAWADAFEKEKHESVWSQYGLFVLGGGSKVDVVADSLRKSVWPGRLTKRTIGDAGFPNDLYDWPEKGQMIPFREDATFLLVAYGLCLLFIHPGAALLHGPEQIADLPVPVAESPGAVRIGHPERSHLVEYLAPNSVFNSLPRQRSSPHLRPDDRLVTIDRVLHHASLGVA